MSAGRYIRNSGENPRRDRIITELLKKRESHKTCPGCEETLPIRAFRIRLYEKKSFYLTIDGWCIKCYRKRDADMAREKYKKSKLPDPRYYWDESIQSHRVISNGECITTIKREVDAKRRVKNLIEAKLNIHDLFTRLPAPRMVYDNETGEFYER